jgi:hypothetical protein
MVFCSSQMLEKFSSHESKTSDLKISLAWVMNKTCIGNFIAWPYWNVQFAHVFYTLHNIGHLQ